MNIATICVMITNMCSNNKISATHIGLHLLLAFIPQFKTFDYFYFESCDSSGLVLSVCACLMESQRRWRADVCQWS